MLRNTGRHLEINASANPHELLNLLDTGKSKSIDPLQNLNIPFLKNHPLPPTKNQTSIPPKIITDLVRLASPTQSTPSHPDPNQSCCWIVVRERTAAKVERIRYVI